MLGTISLIIIFLVFWWYLVEYIKYFNTGDPNETDELLEIFYDFKPNKKKILALINPKFLKKDLEIDWFLLYIDVIVIFFLLNILTLKY